MKQDKKTSVSLSEDEVAILDAIAKRMDCSRSAVVRHLVLYQGLCGGDMPLTSQILQLGYKSRIKAVAEIRRRAEQYDPATPQKFREWVKETLGQDDANIRRSSAGILVGTLLNSIDNPPPPPASEKAA